MESRLLLAADFGDAPASYSTLSVDGGALHEAVGPLLGSLRTEEPDGLPTLAADGDVGDDGVTFAFIRAGQLDATAVLSISGTTGTAYADAWIDFNGDGSFDSVGERVAARFAVHDGINELKFAVPADTAAGSTFARFRISTNGVASPGGAASDGEVEDYTVTIAPPRSSAGEFGSAVRLNTPEIDRTSDMLVEDADGDGDLDFYTVSGDSSQPQNPTYEFVFGIYLHENVGDGQFATRLVTPLEGNWAYGLHHRDFTGDGRLDFLAINGSTDTLDLFEQLIDGTYVRRSTAMAGRVTIIEAGDLDGDGDRDVMGADVYDDRISWFENDGTGGFVEHTLDDSSTVIEHALLTDLDSDGNLDIAYAGYFAPNTSGQSMELAWLRNDGGGAFVRSTQPITAIPYFKLAAAGDFDGDGDVDLFASGGDSAWLENDGSQGFTTHVIDAPSAYQLRGTAVDIDGDGDLDVAAASYGAVPSASVVVVYLGDGAGNFVREDLDLSIASPLRMHVADMDDDGRLDVVVVDADHDVVSSYRQTSAGTFDEQVLMTSLSGSFQPVDLDQDGDLDFVTRVRRPYYNSHALWWYEQTAPGNFVIRQIISETGGGGVTAIDLDRDGDLDLLGSYDNNLAWFENDGTQQFTKRPLYVAIERLNTYAPADYDGDGDYDIVIGNGTTGVTFSSVRLLENNGNQQFALRQLTTTDHYASRVAPADLDGDGDIDVFVGGTNQVAVSWFEQVVSGGLVRHVIDPTPMFVDAIGMADLDADGDLDLVADSLYYRNDGNGTFTKFTLKSTQPKLLAHRFADIDGDGLLDIIASVIKQVNYQPYYENSFVAYRNLGAAGFAPMDLQTGLRHSTQSELADIDGDGDLDGIFTDVVLGEFWFQENVPSVFLEHGSETIVEELNAETVVTVRRGGDSPGELSVEFAIAGTASYGVDYTISGAIIEGTTATVVFPAGVDEVQVVLRAVDDQVVESDETIELQLTAPLGYHVTGGEATVTLESLDYLGDYGDAPASYGTTILSDGARHLAVGPRLGSLRTEELNGSPTLYANGDTGDDGIAVVPLQAGNADSIWQVLLSAAPSGALLDAWIDFNGDGVWDEATEQIARGMPVVNGFNALRIATPATAAAGTTFARVRVSTAGSQAPHGPADDGEVEDYAVTILPPRVASGVFALPMALSTNLSSILDIEPVDFDRDGDVDVVFSSQSSNRIYWLENRGPEASVVAELVSTSTPQHVLVTDVDGDGLLDLVTTGGTGGGVISWHRQSAEGSFTSQPVQTVSSITDLAASDLDLDGDVDLVAATGQSLLWYENDGGEAFTPVDLQLAATSFEAADMSGDGRVDLVASTATEIVLLAQTTRGAFIASALSAFAGAIDVATADLNGDGQRDIWAASAGQAVVLEQQEEMYTTHNLALGPWWRNNTLSDIDGDGDVDLLSGRPAAGGSVWFDNQGGFNFVARQLRGIAGTPLVSAAADFDGNGQLDLLVGTTSPASLVVALAAPAVSVSATTTTFSETATTNLDLRFSRRDDLSSTRTILATIAGLATFGDDYTVAGAATWSNSTGTITFPVGVEEVVVTLIAVNDALVELDEPLVVTIPDASGQVPLAPSSVALTLVSDEYGGNFGDAPGPYPTALVDQGAAHQPLGPHLGDTRDFATEATPTPLADADADDDGVTWEFLQVGAANAAALVDVRNAPAGAIVDIWLDLNRDGAWYSAAEHVVAAREVAAGVERLAFEIPAWAAAGSTFARVRISTAGSIAPNELAADGEVEDYAVTIDPPATTTPLFALAGVIASVAPRGLVASLAPIDFDQDGDIDLVTCGVSSSLAWYENQGPAGFITRVVDPQSSTDFAQISPVDYDRDGDFDLVAIRGNILLWFENAGDATFVPHTLHNKSAITRFVIGEFDGTGQPQIVVSYSVGGNVANLALMKPDGTGSLTPIVIGSMPSTIASWTRHVPIDFDRDGDLDIVAAWSTNSTISSIVLLANGGDGTFTSQPLGNTTTARVADLQAGDIDGDGDQDLVTSLGGSTETTRLAWWEQDANGMLMSHVIAAPHSLGLPTLADVNGDGRVDLVATRVTPSPRLVATDVAALSSAPLPSYAQFLVWLGGIDGTFAYHVDPALPPVRSGSIVAAGDFDQDGDLDLAGVDSASQIAWYRNVPAASGDYNRDGVVDSTDYATWTAMLGSTSGIGLQADGNDNGVVDVVDYAVWRENLPTTSPSVDVNADGIVDSIDLDGWQIGYGLETTVGEALPGDADQDGTVSGRDFLAWQRAYGTTVQSAVATSPVAEPSKTALSASVVDIALESEEFTEPANPNRFDGLDGIGWLVRSGIGNRTYEELHRQTSWHTHFDATFASTSLETLFAGSARNRRGTIQVDGSLCSGPVTMLDRPWSEVSEERGEVQRDASFGDSDLFDGIQSTLSSGYRRSAKRQSIGR